MTRGGGPRTAFAEKITARRFQLLPNPPSLLARETCAATFHVSAPWILTILSEASSSQPGTVLRSGGNLTVTDILVLIPGAGGATAT